jgi:hypothetical protein
LPRCAPHSRPAHPRRRRCRARRHHTMPWALGEGVGRLSAQELLDDLPLELDRMGGVLSHGLSPRKPGSVSRFSGPPPVDPKGCTPIAEVILHQLLHPSP